MMIILIGLVEHIIIQLIMVMKKFGGAVENKGRMYLDAEWENMSVKRIKMILMIKKIPKNKIKSSLNVIVVKKGDILCTSALEIQI